MSAERRSSSAEPADDGTRHNRPTQLPIGIVINPRSALGHGHRTGRRVAGLLADRGLPVVLLSGGNSEECAAAIRRAVPSVRGFLLVGGDGLLSLFLQIPEARALPFGIVPAGSGNDFAREFAVPLRHTKRALNLALRSEAEPRRVDALVVTTPDGVERWVGCGLSVGIDAHINRRANAIKLPLGPLRYQIALIAEIFASKNAGFEVEVDGTSRRFFGLLTTVMNTRTLGGGIPITPGADPTDGRADVITITAASKLRMLSVLGLLAKGKHLGITEVDVVRGRQIRLTADGEIAYADGEHVGEGPFDIRVAERALTVWA